MLSCKFASLGTSVTVENAEISITGTISGNFGTATNAEPVFHVFPRAAATASADAQIVERSRRLWTTLFRRHFPLLTVHFSTTSTNN
ncbi:hypothetical protein T09_15273 [Trichinella sp. T9]|nr:hypothetical protein T09_15273 [Trichinella sp. T9]